MQRGVVLQPARVAWWLGLGAGLLVAASSGIHLLVRVTGRNPGHGLVRFLDVNAEFNLPTFYASALLLATAGLLWLVMRVAGAAGHRRWPWAVLATGFLIMALDESATLHERLAPPLRDYFGEALPGAFYFAWVVPGLVVVGVVGLVLLRFVWTLPRRTRAAFLAAAFLFVGGGLGLELVEGMLFAPDRPLSAVYLAVATTQEALEMAGVILFIWALLDYLERHHPGTGLVVGKPS